MNKDRNQSQNEEQTQNTRPNPEETKPRSSAFNEPAPETQKSTMNPEEADLEQERKDAMTERD